MSDQDIFDNQQPNSPASAPSTNETVAPKAVDPNADLLAQITNPDGTQKYKDTATALKALDNSQKYIATLEQENSSFKAQSDKIGNIESAINRLAENQQSTPSEQPSQGSQTVQLDEQLILDIINKKDAKDTAEANAKNVASKLIDKFGSPEKAKEQLQEKAQSLNTTYDELMVLSRKSPGVVLSLFDHTQVEKESVVNKATGINSSAIEANASKSDGIAQPEKFLYTSSAGEKGLDLMKKIKGEVNAKYGYA
jgi:hypothetical protein